MRPLTRLSRLPRLAPLAAALSLSTLLAACGGGGGGSAPTTSSGNPQSTPTASASNPQSNAPSTNSTSTASTSNTPSSSSTSGYSCTPGTYCYAYLGKTFTISQTLINQQTGNKFSETCSGTIASSPTTVSIGGTSGQTAQVALMSGSCSANGMTLKLNGQIAPNIISADNSNVGYAFPTIETSDGVFSVSVWYPGPQANTPSVLDLNPGASLGVVSGSITIK